MTPIQQEIVDDTEALLGVLPADIYQSLHRSERLNNVLEVVMDLGRLPEARFAESELVLSQRAVTFEDIEYVINRIGAFGEDNRAGIERTLHRISAIRNRAGLIIGLTLRVGRAVFGTIAIIQDIVESGKSILLLGRPGVGKTTMLREVARVLADDFRKRVVIVDTSNEIGGDGDIPHPAIGRSRRMQVASPGRQHAVMIEAVENHMPQVIVIDEIGTELEASAARTIAERGVQLVGTAHGNELENLMQNPTLSDLIGGIQAVTLGDEEARRRGTQKTVLERKAPPTFDVVVEIQSWSHVVVHQDVADTIDNLLRGFPIAGEERTRDDSGEVTVSIETPVQSFVASERRGGRTPEVEGNGRAPDAKTIRIFPYGVTRNRLEQVARRLHVPIQIVTHLEDADIVLALSSHFKNKPDIIKTAETQRVRVDYLRSNTSGQMQQELASLFNLGAGEREGERRERREHDAETEARLEADHAIKEVLERSRTIELSPQPPHIRRIQHALAERYNVGSRSRGKEPNRRVKFFPPEFDDYA